MARRTKAQMRPPVEPTARLLLVVNGHELTGTKFAVWTFHCRDWPELADKYAGESTTTWIVEEFLGRALAGAITTE